MPKNNLGLEIQKTNVGVRISILDTPFVPIFRQNKQLWPFGLNLHKNGSLDRNLKNLSMDSESPPPSYHVCQFWVKMGNFEFFGLNLGKLPNYVRYFSSNIDEGVAESWVEAKMSYVEVDGAGWRLEWARWRWMELDGAGWMWMELGEGGCTV